MNTPFTLVSEFAPAGDQPQAIEALVRGLGTGAPHQTLLGVTGSGKTFTLANVVQRVQRPILVISHNKTLAAQLFSEFRHFFPDNAVRYFISYYDYYLPESYIPQTDTYIAKDASINEEIEKMRLAATSGLLERRDVLIVASVSCIYGLGSPEDFERMSAVVEIGGEMERNDLLRRLVDVQYTRNDITPSRGEFRVNGDTVDIFPAYEDDLIRIEFWGDSIDAVTRRDPLTLEVKGELDRAHIFPARHFVMPQQRMIEAEQAIIAELDEQVARFEQEGRLVEAQRIYQRTHHDLEMIREIGYCSGIENYSRHLSKRPPGSRPFTLIDYFPDDLVVIIDESHATIPQLRAMYNADRSRKRTLVDHGFRLPSALDNRPLNFDEFNQLVSQRIYVSATPGPYELSFGRPVQQVLRPTGLMDPSITIRPLTGQIDDLIAEVREVAARRERVLVTTLTKRTAEDLSEYLLDLDLRVKYIHSEIDAIERVEILRDLRTGNFDCLIGVNLLREGLDLPEVALVAILDADKEGFLRSETALIQTAGRAARNVEGRVILYADRITEAMQRLIDLSEARRRRQTEYNRDHGIEPRSVVRPIEESLHKYDLDDDENVLMVAEDAQQDVEDVLIQLTAEMGEAAEALEFERAAELRDQINALQKSAETGEPVAAPRPQKRRNRHRQR